MEGTLGFIINFFLIYIIARSLARIFINLSSKKKEAKEVVQAPVEQIIVEMVKDQICGRSIPLTQAQILVRDNEKHYFCSWDCRQKYLASEIPS